jgi:hypothetical protein
MARKPIKQYATLTDDSGAEALSVATGGAVTVGVTASQSSIQPHAIRVSGLPSGSAVSRDAVTLQGANGNSDNLITRFNRTGTGADWSDTNWTLIRKVDSTDMGFIKFGHQDTAPLSFGKGTTTLATVTGTGAWTLGLESGNLAQTINGGIKAGYSGCTAYHAFYMSVSSDTDTPLIVARSATENGSEQYVSFYENATSAASPGSESGGIRRNSGDTAYEFYNASDEKLKDIHGIYSGGLEVVKNIPVKYYSWKGEHNKGSFGYIAQDVQKYLPSCVSQDSNGILNLGTADMIPVMWNAIQELSAKNDALEARLAALEAKP